MGPLIHRGHVMLLYWACAVKDPGLGQWGGRYPGGGKIIQEERNVRNMEGLVLCGGWG